MERLCANTGLEENTTTSNLPPEVTTHDHLPLENLTHHGVIIDHQENLQLSVFFKMRHSYNRILFGHKKGWSTDMCYHMDELGKHYTKWKKPVTKDHILYDSLYVKCPEQLHL